MVVAVFSWLRVRYFFLFVSPAVSVIPSPLTQLSAPRVHSLSATTAPVFSKPCASSALSTPSSSHSLAVCLPPAPISCSVLSASCGFSRCWRLSGLKMITVGGTRLRRPCSWTPAPCSLTPAAGEEQKKRSWRQQQGQQQQELGRRTEGLCKCHLLLVGAEIGDVGDVGFVAGVFRRAGGISCFPFPLPDNTLPTLSLSPSQWSRHVRRCSILFVTVRRRSPIVVVSNHLYVLK